MDAKEIVSGKPLTDSQLYRKEEIKKKIALYTDFVTFKKDNQKDYSWIGVHGLANEMYGHFPDYIRKIQYKKEREEKADPINAKIRKIKRNASQCYCLKEFKRRFAESYNATVGMQMEDEIFSLFKESPTWAAIVGLAMGNKHLLVAIERAQRHVYLSEFLAENYPSYMLLHEQKILDEIKNQGLLK